MLLFECYSSEIKYLNNYQLTGSGNFLHGYEALNEDGLYNAVIEIPAGTNDKWEVSKDGKMLEIELKNSQPRVINYLPYPTNYGFIPKTSLPIESGGDSDALDILVLSQKPLERGKVVKVKIIGMIKMKDKGLNDNKIISVLPNSKFSKIKSIKKLQLEYPGIMDILNIWFSNYKGSKINIEGYGKKKEAKNLVKLSQNFYEKSN